MNTSLKIYVIIVLGIFLNIKAFGQENKVLYGIVLNDSRQPISQVTIKIPGGADPVFTDENGEFELQRTNDNNWLLVQPLNEYQEKHVRLKNQDSIVIYLNREEIDSRFDEIALPLSSTQRRDMIAHSKH